MVRDMVGSRAGMCTRLCQGRSGAAQPEHRAGARVLGGWTPQVPLERGLEATIAYFRGLNSRNNGAA